MNDLIERLIHFEQNQVQVNDEYGAEVLYKARLRIQDLEAEREQIANMALEAILQAPHHKIWYLERIMEACGAPVDKWREQHEWEEGVAP